MPERVYCERWCLSPTIRDGQPYDLPYLIGRFAFVAGDAASERWGMQVIGNARLYTYFRVVRRESTDEMPWYTGKSQGLANKWGGFSGIARVREFPEPPEEVMSAYRSFLEGASARQRARGGRRAACPG